MAKTQLTFPELWNVDDIAKLTGLSQETVRRYCREGRVSHRVTPGGEYRFSDDQISQFTICRPASSVKTKRRGVRA